ncbi:MAG: hypothetical protein JWM87_2703 [Candidatus Eremiobacteraeota bacterium]|nr:hypothetical protein [Candidatus Eremiobacteraeota bacterium]
MKRTRTVILAGGRSERMGFNKLTAPFDGVPLGRRVVLGLRELEPLLITTPAVAEVLSDLPFVRLVVTEPTAGPSQTLAIAHAAIPSDVFLTVLPCDVPFLDASLVTAFVKRVSNEADLAWPVVVGTPGHPVLWSPKARTRIARLRDDEPPSRVRRDCALRIEPIEECDDAYVTDVDTPGAWEAAEARAVSARSSR